MNVCEYCGERKAKKRFCNRSCSNAWQHANGVRRTYVNDKTTWDWWVQKHGIEEALQLKEHHRQATSIATMGENNPMYGRHDHVHGLIRESQRRKGLTIDQIHGEVEAQRIRAIIKASSTGVNNPAYGKVYDRGGRSRIQGVYRGIRFRSSYELSWLVDVLSRGINVTVPQRVRYVINGRQRTYLPDFQVGNQVIEIKPSALVTHLTNVLKFEAAQCFCTLHGLEYRVLTERDLKLLTLEQIAVMTDIEWNKGAREYINEQV